MFLIAGQKMRTRSADAAGKCECIINSLLLINIAIWLRPPTTPRLPAGPVVASRRHPGHPGPGLGDVLDLIAPSLDQRDLCAVQATCTTLRNLGISGEIANFVVYANVRSDEQKKSFLLWLGPRAHAVRFLTYRESDMRSVDS